MLTRNPDSAICKALRASNLGFQIVKADLGEVVEKDDVSLLKECVEDCVGVYLHALQGDTRKVTWGGDRRARKLLEALVEYAAPNCHVVMNSAAAEKEHGVGRIEQMHRIETVFRNPEKNNTSSNKNRNRTTGRNLSLGISAHWSDPERGGGLSHRFGDCRDLRRRGYCL